MPGFVDLVNNPLLIAGAEGLFIKDDDLTVAATQLQIYRFLDASIRDADAQEGQFFLRRFLVGPQIVWSGLQGSFEDLRKLWTVTDCPDELLHKLKLHLGWTRDTDHLTEKLSAVALRRLLLISIALWQARSTEHSLTSIVTAIFGVRSRVWNWFDLRWILDDGILTEEHQGHDPVLFGLPAPPDMDHMRSCVRIMDNLTGAVDRDLCIAFIKLFRTNGERLTVVWLRFLDDFKDDLKSWTSTDDGAEIVSESMMLLDDSKIEEAYAHGFAALDTHDHLGYARIKGIDGGAFGVTFWRQDNGDAYMIRLDVAANTLRLESIVSGVISTLATYNFISDLEILLDGVWYGLRWTASIVGVNTEIDVFVDGEKRLSFIDVALYESGSFGLYHSVGGTIACSEIEIMPLSPEITEIGINP
jgi:hypothetical protein